MTYKIGDKVKITETLTWDSCTTSPWVGGSVYIGECAGCSLYTTGTDSAKTTGSFLMGSGGTINLEINKEKQMKYYRVKKETFLWDEGAIISNKDSSGEYRAIDPIFNRMDDQTEYISANIIEAEENKDFFDRVYPVNLVTKTVYKAKEQAKEMLQKEYK
jgi:hypothetical protein